MTEGRVATRALFVGSVFSSGFLLFLVQPIVARQLLPWFGGGAGVWSVCLVFFQTVLVLGYAYSHAIARRFSPVTQGRMQSVLLAASLLTLPIVASPRWHPDHSTEPVLRIIAVLTATIGLPYFTLSTTSPLLQRWFALLFPHQTASRLFAVSNASAIAALVAYPFFIEPAWTTKVQAYSWSFAYAGYVLLTIATALAVRRAPASGLPSIDQPAAIPLATQLLWLACGATGSALLVAITSHLTLNVASVPFLWILPLASYLTSFVLCFSSRRWYRRGIW